MNDLVSLEDAEIENQQVEEIDEQIDETVDQVTNECF